MWLISGVSARKLPVEKVQSVPTNSQFSTLMYTYMYTCHWYYIEVACITAYVTVVLAVFKSMTTQTVVTCTRLLST